MNKGFWARVRRIVSGDLLVAGSAALAVIISLLALGGLLCGIIGILDNDFSLEALGFGAFAAFCLGFWAYTVWRRARYPSWLD